MEYNIYAVLIKNVYFIYSRAFSLNLLVEETAISINRSNVVEKVKELYSNQEFCEVLPQFTFEGESARDLDGPKRAVYNMFWDEIFKMHFEGANTVVPRFGPDMCDELVILFGRIALHGYICSGMFPTRISKVFIKAMMFGEESIEQSELVQGLLEYVTDHEREFLSHCMSKTVFSPEEKEELLEVVAQFGVRSIPAPTNLYEQLVKIGRCELLQKSVWAFRPFRKGITDVPLQDPVWRIPSDLDVFYEELSVTTEKVANLTHVDDEASLTKSQAKVFGFLRRYIKACNNEKVKVLYRFFTGSDVFALKELKVIFHFNLGSLPHISAHTCSGIIDMPSDGYVSYHDFQSQLDALLHNPESWKFHVV